MHAPPYSSVPIGGSSWGKSRACTCLAISSSWAHCVEAQQREGVPVHVLEAGEHGAPDRGFVRERCGRRGGRPLILETPQTRRMTKTNPAFAPFVELGQDVFGNERNLRGPADELVLLGSALGSDQHEHRGTVGRGDGYPAAAGSKLGVEGQIESKLAQIEAQAAILVSDVDVDGVDSEVRLGRRRVAIASEYMPVAPSAGCGSGKVPRYGNVQIWTLKRGGACL